MGPYGAPGLPPTKPQPPTPLQAIFPSFIFCLQHKPSEQWTHEHRHACIAPRVFCPLIPLMVINLEPVRQKGILYISTKWEFWNLHSPLASQGNPNQSLNPSHFSFMYSPARMHKKHPWWHKRYCIYFWLTWAGQNFTVVSAVLKMNPRLCVGAVRGGSGPWRRG